MKPSSLKRSWCCLILLFTAIIAIIFLGGCQTSTFRAARLPLEYRVSAQSQTKTIDFSRVASPGTSNSIIAPSDLLEVTVSTGRHDEKITPVKIRVANDGSIDVPVIGPVPVAGMEEFAASQSIANLAIQRGMYRHPLVTVEIESKAVNRITVLGAVEKPGTYELPRGNSDLVRALAESGGLTEEAGTELEIVRQPSIGIAAYEQESNQKIANHSGEVQLAAYQDVGRPAKKRNFLATSATTIKLDLSASKPMEYADYRLNDLDVVRVVPRDKRMIHVTGLVTNPGQFKLPQDQDLRLLDAVALAGGRSSPVADKVYVIRHIKNRAEPLVIQASLSQAKKNGLENLRLTAEDTVSVEQTPVTAVIDTLGKFFRLTFGVASNTVF